MNLGSWLKINRDKFGSEYEILFATKVLSLVDGLKCEAINTQHPFVDNDGKNRYCDFTIIESEAVRIAIEIDGYDKRGTGIGMSYDDFLDWQRRQASLASQGWHVLRFANRDVRDEPRRCAEHISRLLNKLRQAQIGRVEIVTFQHKPEESLVVPIVETGKSQKAQKKNYWLLCFFALSVLAVFALMQMNGRKPSDKMVPSPLTGLPVLGDSFTSHVSTEVPPLDVLLAKTSGNAETILREIPNQSDVRIVKSAYGTLDCKNPVDWSLARNYIGQVVTIIGPLLATKPRPDVTGSPMWLDVGGIYPSQQRVTIVVWGRNWSKFDPAELNAEYWFETLSDEMEYASICIKGRVAEHKGVPQIELQDLSQLRIAFRPK
jgi:very-short-patch-repair endonuclease